MTNSELPAALLASPSFQLERLRRRTRDEVEASLAEHKITLRGYWVLTCLSGHHAASQASLCEILAIDASDMVRLIDSLEKNNWVKRERDPKDRRRQIVMSTKKGRNKQKDLSELVTQAEDRALDESTSKQLKHLRKLAKSIIAAEEE
ncbi:MarR family transcriptional regulator [Corynebacterium sp. sy017]|uniref:MarR family winged helix-turn-helix transcriptional regulator n=1 Tax=unclassified Corynebacterium TaxID=2624378 RepID=UPI001185A715|nr:MULTISPECIES: MarR family winged helix-turn-helix transcriptional regulator [unclassified Corynebacterium]MBP3088466.1 MarR family transcriptional regulator [Corynebacterium sp. sy017]QDZ41901.1 winged helix-turn-helix transcriptional regulator [Corynebacterium sp. sy039]TSD91775.1 MarR family transcriptional regulator [Corynebacterium sp. SY003]